jgi:signal transduction histidine kinase
VTETAVPSVKRPQDWLERFLGSMTGRLFVILLFGTGLAAVASLSIADMRYRADLMAFRNERTVDRIESYASVLKGLDASEAADMARTGGAGLQAKPAAAVRGAPDLELNRRLSDGRLGEIRATAWSTDATACRRTDTRVIRDATHEKVVQTEAQALGLKSPACWVIDLVDSHGVKSSMVTGAPPPAARPRVLDPWFLGVEALALALLSFFVARFASRPVRQMATAAQALGESLDAPPMAEAGPTEVRQAADAFNTMQTRLRRAMDDKAQVLAAVTHDLQTPLTRLRLRVEKVTDPELKERLLGDLAATQALVKEGLELARSEPSQEPFARLALDSLLRSIADDEDDAGRPVVFIDGCDCDVMVRPKALRRCVANLIENAVVHGGNARISARVDGEKVFLDIEDDGPGIADADLERVLEPFVRLEDSRSRETGGSGLGLTIAGRLARDNRARLVLRSRKPHGLTATLILQGAGPA